MRKITVAMAGQIRNVPIFTHSLNIFVTARNAGYVDRIVVSTWTSELKKIEHLLPRLTANGVTVVSVDEPAATAGIPGTLAYQLRSIDLALETIEDTAWVLRTRPDILFNAEAIAKLCEADLSIDAPWGGMALRHKLWVPFVEACQPMCISDLTFFGHYTDIVKLQHYDFFHEITRTSAVFTPDGKPITSYDAEIRRYTPAFCSDYRIVMEYYRLYTNFLLGICEIRDGMLNILRGEDYYWQYMAMYFHILRKYFLIGKDIGDVSVHLVRPEAVDQTRFLACLNLLESYTQAVLEANPAAALDLEFCTQLPLYCTSSRDMVIVARHLEGAGIPLAQYLDQAMNYRKDAARIEGLAKFKDKLLDGIATSKDFNKPIHDAWTQPFSGIFIDIVSV
jgi:hypothetical protein